MLTSDLILWLLGHLVPLLIMVLICVMVAVVVFRGLFHLLGWSVTGLSPLASQQISSFRAARRQASAKGELREAKVCQAKELVVYTTGLPMPSVADASYPQISQPGHLESLTDQELDELIARHERMSAQARKQLRRESIERRARLRPLPDF